MDELLDIAAVAAYLGVSERTVYNRVRAGDLPAVKVGRLWRVRAADLEGWLAVASRARGGETLDPSVRAGISLAAEAGAVPSRTQLEAVVSAFEDRVERRLAFVGVLSWAYGALGWPPPVIVGGHAVEFWTAGGYATVDIDLVSAAEPFAQVLSAWGFAREGRHWYDDALGIVVEAPGAQLTAAGREHVAAVRLGRVTALVLGIEDLIVGRLNACAHWCDEESCLWADALLASPHELDLPYLREIAAEADVLEQLDAALARAGRS